MNIFKNFILIIFLTLLPTLSYSTCEPGVITCDDTNHSNGANIIVPVVVVAAGLGIWYVKSRNKGDDKKVTYWSKNSFDNNKPYKLSLTPLSKFEQHKVAVKLSFDF